MKRKIRDSLTGMSQITDSSVKRINDFTMTQEEQADSVLWEETSEAPKSSALQVDVIDVGIKTSTRKLSNTIPLKSKYAKQKKNLRLSTDSSECANISEIMNLLGNSENENKVASNADFLTYRESDQVPLNKHTQSAGTGLAATTPFLETVLGVDKRLEEEETTLTQYLPAIMSFSQEEAMLGLNNGKSSTNKHIVMPSTQTAAFGFASGTGTARPTQLSSSSSSISFEAAAETDPASYGTGTLRASRSSNGTKFTAFMNTTNSAVELNSNNNESVVVNNLNRNIFDSSNNNSVKNNIVLNSNNNVTMRSDTFDTKASYPSTIGGNSNYYYNNFDETNCSNVYSDKQLMPPKATIIDNSFLRPITTVACDASKGIAIPLPDQQHYDVITAVTEAATQSVNMPLLEKVQYQQQHSKLLPSATQSSLTLQFKQPLQQSQSLLHERQQQQQQQHTHIPNQQYSNIALEQPHQLRQPLVNQRAYIQPPLLKSPIAGSYGNISNVVATNNNTAGNSKTIIYSQPALPATAISYNMQEPPPLTAAAAAMIQSPHHHHHHHHHHSSEIQSAMQSFDEVSLSDEALAMLMELEMKALTTDSISAPTNEIKASSNINSNDIDNNLMYNKSGENINIENRPHTATLLLARETSNENDQGADSNTNSKINYGSYVNNNNYTTTANISTDSVFISNANQHKLNHDTIDSKFSKSKSAERGGGGGVTSTATVAVSNKLLLCMRLIALDVMDDPNRRVKQVRAFQPGNADFKGQRHSPRESHITNTTTTVADNNDNNDDDAISSIVLVELCGDWYNSSLVSGDTFHVLDMGPDNNNDNDDNSCSSTGNIAAETKECEHSIFSTMIRNNSNVSKSPTNITMNEDKLIRLTNEWGLLVLHPDILISPTKVAESCSCIRRGVLTDKLRSFGDISAAAVMGNLKHAFIENLTEKIIDIMQNNSSSYSINSSSPSYMTTVRTFLTNQVINNIIDSCKRSQLEELCVVGCSDEGINNDLNVLVDPVLQWVVTMFQQGLKALLMGSSSNSNVANNNSLFPNELARTTSIRGNNNINNSNITATSANYDNNSNSNNNNHHSASVAILEGKSATGSKKAISTPFDYYLHSIDSCEETVWATVLGMKGQIDMVGKVKLVSVAEMTTTNTAAMASSSILPTNNISYPHSNRCIASSSKMMMMRHQQLVEEVLLPIELKTGKWRPSTIISHRAQVMLYILMMTVRERCGARVYQGVRGGNNIPKHGLILYISETETKLDLIRPNWPEIRALVQSRNKLAGYIRDSAQGYNNSGDKQSVLPPLLRNIFDCQYCYQASECMLYHAALEGGSSVTSGVSELYSYVLKGLTPSHLRYLKQWDDMMTLEAIAASTQQQSSSSSMSPWTQSSADKEASGEKCIGGLLMHSLLKTIPSLIPSSSLQSIADDSRDISSSSTVGVKQMNDGAIETYLVIFKRRKCNYIDNCLIGGVSGGNLKDYCGFSVGDRVQISAERDPNSILTGKDNSPSHTYMSTPPAVVAAAETTTTTMNSSNSTYNYKVVSSVAATVNTAVLPVNDMEDIARNGKHKQHQQRQRIGKNDSILFRSSSRVLMSMEVNVCGGIISVISNDEIHVQLSQESKRLTELHNLQYSSSSNNISTNWTFRIDKDDILISISTMRSNLLALFSHPYSPKLFQQSQLNYNQQYQNSLNNTISTENRFNSSSPFKRSHSASAAIGPSSLSSSGSMVVPLNARWRQLIVDLAAPVFRSPPLDINSSSSSRNNNSNCVIDVPITKTLTLDVEVLLMTKPASMTVSVYKQALLMLHNFLQNGCSNSIVKQTDLPNCLQSLISCCDIKVNVDDNKISKSSNTNYATAAIPSSSSLSSTASSCVSRGPAGQLRIFGGLIVYPGCNPLKLCEEFKNLNAGQRAAVRKILLAEDYALLLGLPGTGKTSTLSLVVRIMLARGQKVLLTSYTHTAVDHLLLKLIEAGMKPAQVMRLGGRSYVHPNVHNYILDTKRSNIGNSGLNQNTKKGLNTIAALQHYCANVRLVACTVLTASRSHLLRHLSMDCCVMDEAGQIAQPAALGAVLAARTCILVGDDYQLPPLIVSIEAQGRGMNISLFKRFIEAHPQAVCCLTAQYRMNDDIMALCNELIYEHRMQCAHTKIAAARLRLVNLQQLPQLLLQPQLNANTAEAYNNSYCNSHSNNWLLSTLQPDPAVIFLNTDFLLQGNSSKNMNDINNNRDSDSTEYHMNCSVTETQIIRKIISALKLLQFDLKQVGIISPYRAQVQLLQNTIKLLLLSSNTTTTSDEQVMTECCDISTVDKYQGKDKQIIILSTVKSGISSSSSNKDENITQSSTSIGNLLRDWRRINVSITRAKHKLIIIGSSIVMQQVPVLQHLVKLSNNRKWTIDLPTNAIDV